MRKAITAEQIQYVRLKGEARALHSMWDSPDRINAFRLLMARTGCTWPTAYYYLHQVDKYPTVSALERRVNRMSPEDRERVCPSRQR